MRRVPLALSLVALVALSGGAPATAGGSAHHWLRSGVVTAAKGEQVRLHFVNDSAETVTLEMHIETAGGASQGELTIYTFQAQSNQTLRYMSPKSLELRAEVRVSADPATPVGDFLASFELMRKDSHGIWRTVTVLDSFSVADEP